MTIHNSPITSSVIHFLQRLDKKLTLRVQKNQQNLDNMGIDQIIADSSDYLKWLFNLE